MKKTILLISAICLLFSCELAYETDMEKQEIARVLYAQQGAWNEGDIDTYLKGYIKSDELRFVSRSGVDRGYSGVEAMYKRGYNNPDDMGLLTFELSEIKLLGENYASVIGLYMQEFPNKKERRGRFTLILKKTEKGWKIIQDHTS